LVRAPPLERVRLGGRELLIGSARCGWSGRALPATEVNPETGERDANPIAELKAAFGTPTGVLPR